MSLRTGITSPFLMRVWENDYADVIGEIREFSNLSFSLGMNRPGSWSFSAPTQGRNPSKLGGTGETIDELFFTKNDTHQKSAKIITIHDNYNKNVTASDYNGEVFRGFVDEDSLEYVSQGPNSSSELDLFGVCVIGGREITGMLEYAQVWPTAVLRNGLSVSGVFNPPTRTFASSNPTSILSTLFDEAKNNSETWSPFPMFDQTSPIVYLGTFPTIDATVDIGTSLMDLFNAFVQGGYINWWYYPPAVGTPITAKARILVASYGSTTDKSAFRAIYRSHTTRMSVRRYRRDIFNRVLVLGDNGVYEVRTQNADANKFNTREATIRQDGTTVGSVLQTVGNTFLEKAKRIVEEWTVVMPYVPRQDFEGGRPFIDYTVGDTVTLDTGRGVPEVKLITSMSYSSSRKSFGNVTITLGDPVTKRLIELSRDVKRLLGGIQGV